jgi:enamine deaminase RidA (YjgF/YER057c/UK114 family)
VKSFGSDHLPSAFQVGDWVFTSGGIAVDEIGLVPLEATVHPTFPNYGSTIKLQTRYVLKKLAETLKVAGTSLDSTCRAAVFLTDMRYFGAMDEVWREFFTEPPARTVVATPSLGIPGAVIAIDLIAQVE